MEDIQTINANKSTKNFLPAVAVIVSLLMVAVEPIVVKLGYQLNMRTFDMLILRFLASGLMILPFAKSFRVLKAEEFKRMMPVCLLYTVINIFLYISLHYLSAIAMITFLTTTPAFVAIVNKRRGKDILAKTFWPGFFLCFFGVLLTIEAFDKGVTLVGPLGILFILLAISGSTIYRTQMDGVTKEFGPLLTSCYIFLFNGIIALFALPFVQMSAGYQTITYGVWLGIASVVGNIAFLWAIKVLGSTKISIWGILQRPLIIFLSAIVLKETLSIPQIIGIALVLIGIQMAKVKRVK